MSFSPSRQKGDSQAQVSLHLTFRRRIYLANIYAVRELLPLEQVPGVISVLGGKPNPFSFPITGLTIDVHSASDPPEEPGTPLTISSEALADGLQYGLTAGYGPLIEWLMGLQAYSHGRRDGEGWRISTSCGSQDALFKVRTLDLA